MNLSEEVAPGQWYFFVYAYDRIGNRSNKSPSTGHFVNLTQPYLGALNSGNFMDSVVAPVNGTVAGKAGEYEFRVVYTEGNGYAPDYQHHVFIDFNGNGSYENEEKIQMAKLTAATAVGSDLTAHYDGSFINGEVYFKKITIAYQAQSAGVIKYQLHFQTHANCPEAVKWPTDSIDNTIELQLVITPNYDAPEFSGNQPPAKPILMAPIDDEEVFASNLKFEWQQMQDPDNDSLSLLFFICEDQNFSGCEGIPASYFSEVAMNQSKSQSEYWAWFFIVPIGILGFTLNKSMVRKYLMLTLFTGLVLFCNKTADTGSDDSADDSESPGIILPLEKALIYNNLEINKTYYWKLGVTDNKSPMVFSDVAVFRTK